MLRTLSDFTIGTMIMLVHVALARRDALRRSDAHSQTLTDGTRVWRTQISP